MQCIFVPLHVVALLVAAAAQHLVAAGEPALQPLRPGPLHGRCDTFRGRELTPVEGFEPFCSFTVTQMLTLLFGDMQLVLFARVRPSGIEAYFAEAYLKAVIPECRW